MEFTTLTNMCMICDGEKFLVQNRVGDDWTGIALPGGHVEKGEPFTDAVIREMREETGLEITSPRLCGVKNWISHEGNRYIVMLYIANNFSGELKSSEEGEVFWTTRDKLSEMKLAKGMAETFRMFFEEGHSEHFCYFEDGIWKDCIR